MSTVSEHRPISPSEHVHAALVEALAVDRWLESGGQDCTIADVDRVLDRAVIEEQERTLGISLPDDLLALFGAGCDGLNISWLCQLGGLDERTRLLRERTGERTWVAIGMRRGAFLGWDPSDPQRTNPYLTLMNKGERHGRRVRLTDWISNQLELWLDDLVIDDKTAELMVADGNLQRFVVTTARRAPVKQKERRVQHKKFGVGRVLEALPDDKLRIDFDGTVKTLMARFVEDI